MNDRWKKWLRYGAVFLMGFIVCMAFMHQSNASLVNVDQLNATLIANNTVLLGSLVRSNDEFQKANKTIGEMNVAMQRQNDGIAETKELLARLIGDGKLDEAVVDALNDKGWQLPEPKKPEQEQEQEQEK